MVYHMGHRARAPLYATAFTEGIKKSRTSIERALAPLEVDNIALIWSKNNVVLGG